MVGNCEGEETVGVAVYLRASGGPPDGRRCVGPFHKRVAVVPPSYTAIRTRTSRDRGCQLRVIIVLYFLMGLYARYHPIHNSSLSSKSHPICAQRRPKSVSRSGASKSASSSRFSLLGDELKGLGPCRSVKEDSSCSGEIGCEPSKSSSFSSWTLLGGSLGSGWTDLPFRRRFLLPGRDID